MEYCAKSEAITNEFNKGDNGQWIKKEIGILIIRMI